MSTPSLDFIYTILNIVDGTKEGMTNPSSVKTYSTAKIIIFKSFLLFR